MQAGDDPRALCAQPFLDKPELPTAVLVSRVDDQCDDEQVGEFHRVRGIV